MALLMPDETSKIDQPTERRGVGKRGPDRTTREVRNEAREMLLDPEYRKSLRLRLIAGIAPHMEKLLWHYAYGVPKVTVDLIVEKDPLREASAEQLRERARQIADRIFSPKQLPSSSEEIVN